MVRAPESMRPCGHASMLAHSLNSFDDEIASGVVALSSHSSTAQLIVALVGHPEMLLVGPIGQESTEGLLVVSVDLAGCRTSLSVREVPKP